MSAFTTIRLLHRDCATCEQHAETAATYASATGSVGGTYGDKNGDRWTHMARVHRTALWNGLRAEHDCVQDIGLNASCGDPASDTRGGFWYCDRHASGYDADVRAAVWADEQEAAGWP